MTELETRAEATKRLADKRVPAAEQALELVGRLGGRHYELSDEQRDRILRKLQDALERTKAQLTGANAFSL